MRFYQLSSTAVKYEDIQPAAKLYSQFLLDGGLVALQTQYMRCQQYCERQTPNMKKIDCVLEALRVATELGTNPAISVLLRMFATLPVTTATGERSFSALKHIKNYLRSTMGEEMPNGHAHLYINTNINLGYDKVIDEFGKCTDVSRLCDVLSNLFDVFVKPK